MTRRPRLPLAVALPVLLSLAPPRPAQARALGPGVAVRQVVAPPQLVSGVRTLQVGPFEGPGAKGLAAEIKAALADPERQVGMGTAADLAGAALKAGAQVGGQMVASQLGGGFAGKLVGGVVEGAGKLAADAVEDEKVVLDDGLRVDVFRVVEAKADGQLLGRFSTQPETTTFTKEVDATDDKGNVLKDGNGVVIKTKVTCTRRTVTATLAWELRARGAAAATGSATGSASDEHCPGDSGKIAEFPALEAAAVSGHGAAVVAQIAPAWRVSRLPLKRTPDLKLPLARVRAGAFGDALCVLHHAAAALPEDAEVALNEAALLEALGHHAEAAAAYARAATLDPKLRLAPEGAARVEARVAEVQQMTAAYGLSWTVGPAPFAACPALPPGRPVALRKDAVLRAAPGGAALAELEKGERLVVVGEAADGFVPVARLDGTRGVVEAKSIQ